MADEATELPCECTDDWDEAEWAETAETSDFSDSQSDSDSAMTLRLLSFFFSFLATKSALLTA